MPVGDATASATRIGTGGAAAMTVAGANATIRARTCRAMGGPNTATTAAANRAGTGTGAGPGSRIATGAAAMTGGPPPMAMRIVLATDAMAGKTGIAARWGRGTMAGPAAPPGASTNPSATRVGTTVRMVVTAGIMAGAPRVATG